MEERKCFLEAASIRRSFPDQLGKLSWLCTVVLFNRECIFCTALSSVGAEHCVLGCAAFSRLSNSLATEVKPVQLSLLAVRKSCRKMGIGRRLMQVLAPSCRLIDALMNYD